VKTPKRRTRKELAQHWLAKWRHRYRLVLLDESSFEERFSMVLNRRNVFLAVGSAVLFLIVSTTFLIAYTPLREYIPGYSSTALRREAVRLNEVTDSLVDFVAYQESFIQHIQFMVDGSLPPDTLTSAATPPPGWSAERLLASERERKLRQEVEARESQAELASEGQMLQPVAGLVLRTANAAQGRFGLEIDAVRPSDVVAVDDGTVLAIEGTTSLGYSMTVHHSDDRISRYVGLNRVTARPGSSIKRGETLGRLLEEDPENPIPFKIELWIHGRPVSAAQELGYRK
jgi:murein DD-endopeptidase MepM/ murein hydrolase activator NlpD